MTSVVIKATGAFQYASDGLLSDELFCTPDVGVSIDSIVMQHVHGFSDSANTLYLQLHEGTPTLGDNPLVCLKIPAGLTGSWSPAGSWQSYGGELGWYVSSTADTYTASTEKCWINAQGVANVGVT